MKELKFSIIIPTFNRVESTIRAVESVLKQTYQNFEVIVVDDCSPAYFDFSEHFNHEKVFYYRLDENRGAAAARNLGVSVSTGDYIAYLDSDDEFLDTKLYDNLEAIHSCQYEPNTVTYSQLIQKRGCSELIRPEAEKKGSLFEYLFINWGLISTITIVLPINLANKVCFDESLRRHQDYDYCLELEKIGAKFVMINKPLSIFHDEQDINRISIKNGYVHSLKWFNKIKDTTSKRELSAFKLRVLAPMESNFSIKLSYIFEGLKYVPEFRGKEGVLLIFKAIFPNGYRKLSTFYMKLKS